MPEIHDLKIVYVGSAGVLSTVPLRILLRAGINIEAIALTAESIHYLQQQPPTIADISIDDQGTLSLSANLLEIAEAFHIPVITLQEPLEKNVDKLKELDTNLILISCFSKRIPRQIFELPQYGCFNMHPSLLPAYRGPSPIHWQVENRVLETGTTIHQISAEFDTGDIAIQKELSLTEPLDKPALAYKLAVLGGEAFVELLDQIEENRLQLSAQDESRASYYGYPQLVG